MGTNETSEPESHDGQVGESDDGSSPLYETNFDGHLPLHWLQPKDPTSAQSILSSFKDLQLKTHRTLYGTTNSTIVPPRDKSPKGSVDLPIRHLVDLINSHSRFCTLSSCSGRLSLFDPSGNSQNENKTSNFTEESGKGRGNWVVVSHYPLPPEALVQAMADNETTGQDSLSSPWTFRFEPMLLHIAAVSLEDGRRLLTIALNLGFRESGLVVTEKRVTVAIRSHSLATATPLFPTTAKTSWSLPASYLRALVRDANQRLEANWKHLDKLYRSIESNLFQVRSVPAPLVIRNQGSCIPSLNLWNVASIQKQSDENKQEVWVVGGYGCGPNGSASAKRSSKLYRLEKESTSSTWKGWKVVNSSNNTQVDLDASDVLEIPNASLDTDKTARLRVQWCKGGSFPDLQGMASCQWRESMHLLWGGRKSPQVPSDALFLVDVSKNTKNGIVLDVRGDLPTPRWGHQLLGLSGDRAVLLGGCNHEQGAMDDVFVLHFSSGNEANDNAYFCWERLSIRLPTPRFHFGAALLKRDTIVLLGGLESTRELLQPFESPSACDRWACKIDATQWSANETVPETKAAVVRVETPDSHESFESCFGMACCVLLSSNLLVVTGGVQPNASALPPIQAYWVSSTDSSTLCLRRIKLQYETDNSVDESCLDFGSLVHHCCVTVANDELLLVGGGVPSFAFGESYARSHHVVIDMENSSRTQKPNYGPKSIHSKDSINEKKTPTISDSGGEAKENANVLYVSPKDARQMKKSLHQKGWLEKRYRMIKVQRTNEQNDDDGLTKQMIAIPVSVPSSEAIGVFGEMILDSGEEELPLSTSQYASKAKQTN